MKRLLGVLTALLIAVLVPVSIWVGAFSAAVSYLQRESPGVRPVPEKA
ncbi:MAG: hypothetical protein AB1603_06810 [Chloroflexota bacterium]